MIKINLLGDDTAIDHSAKLMVAGFLLSFVLLFGLFGYLQTNIKMQVAEMDTERAFLQSKFDNLAKKTKTVKELEKKRDTLKTKLGIIATLKKSKIGPVRVLDDLNTALPPRVWLREVSEKGGEFKIRGRALSNTDTAAFMKNLLASNYFEIVDLKETRQMYYSKRTGRVSPTPDIQSMKTADFQKDSRATKQSTVRRGVQSGQRVREQEELVADRNVKIQEFIINAKVRYEGKTQATSATETKKG